MADVGTIPGQSIRYIRRVRVMYCQTLVSPGIGATLQTLPFLSVFMTLLLPTLGYPIKPTDICFLSECSCENCRSSWIRDPLPKEWFGDAWNAKVGYRGVKCWI